MADGYIKKMEAAGFTVREAVDALQPHLGKVPAAKRRTLPQVAAMYRDPANPANTWSGRGRAARWLADFESQGRSRDEFRVVS